MLVQSLYRWLQSLGEKVPLLEDIFWCLFVRSEGFHTESGYVDCRHILEIYIAICFPTTRARAALSSFIKIERSYNLQECGSVEHDQPNTFAHTLSLTYVTPLSIPPPQILVLLQSSNCPWIRRHRGLGMVANLWNIRAFLSSHSSQATRTTNDQWVELLSEFC
jgi:hypothetical protein